MNAYLFGALTTTTASDLITFAVLSIGILFVTVGLRHMMFAVSNDEEFARAPGAPEISQVSKTAALQAEKTMYAA